MPPAVPYFVLTVSAHVGVVVAHELDVAWVRSRNDLDRDVVGARRSGS